MIRGPHYNIEIGDKLPRRFSRWLGGDILPIITLYCLVDHDSTPSPVICNNRFRVENFIMGRC